MDMDVELKKLLKELMDEVGLDPETIDRIERTTKAQHEVSKIIADLDPNEAAQVIVGVVASVCVSYAESLDDALACLAKMQVSALKIIEGAHKNELAPWNSPDDEDDKEEDKDFTVHHKTKQ